MSAPNRDADYAVGPATYDVLGRVMLIVQDSLDDERTLEGMAARAGYAPHHFAHAFRAVYGEAPMAYVRALRLERAAYELTCGDHSVTRIATDAGYSSSDAFTRAFARAFGSSPRTFRNLTRDQPDDPKPELRDGPGLPEGVSEPTVMPYGPLQAVSVLAREFSEEAISAAWQDLYANIPPPEPWGVASVTPPWGWLTTNERREYRAIALTSEAANGSGPPLQPWHMSASWYARFHYQGGFAALVDVYTWVFETWLPATGARWAYAPLVTVFDDRVWFASNFTETVCQIYIPIGRAFPER